MFLSRAALAAGDLGSALGLARQAGGTTAWPSSAA